MFIDSAKIYVKAGSGGRGCQCFYRDKFTRGGIPDGGDGGRGADIIIRAQRNLRTLIDLRYKRQVIASHGGHGTGKKKKGKDAAQVIILVPIGTLITDVSTGSVLRDLAADQEEVIVAKGGQGGRGNQHRTDATPGQPGDERELLLDLKLIADCGVVGFPNAGKSTFISSISNARPEIAAYPFTTKVPVLGVVRKQDQAFVIADIPGLIEGSSGGRGLGDKFLRHVERTKLLVHLIDMASTEGRDPVEDYCIINKELSNYKLEFSRRAQIIVANKMDLEGAAKNLARFKKAVRKKVYPISALKKNGLEEVLEVIRHAL